MACTYQSRGCLVSINRCSSPCQSRAPVSLSCTSLQVVGLAGTCACAVLLDARQPHLSYGTTLRSCPAGPACAPQPEPGCARWQYVCNGPVQYSFTARQYALLQNAGTCTADLDPSYCFAGRSEMLPIHMSVEALSAAAVIGTSGQCMLILSLATERNWQQGVSH